MPLKIHVDEEYKPLMNDILRFFTILVAINLIMFLSNPTHNLLFGSTYTKLMISVLLGVATYWLVIEKLVVFD
jgi:hypothetical protein